jgi:hypothetical protein
MLEASFDSFGCKLLSITDASKLQGDEGALTSQFYH